MPNSLKISPPNSMLFVSDISGGKTPEIVRGKRIWSTPSCVALGCLMEQDGPTDVTLGLASEVALPERPAFDGVIETPSRVVVVSTTEHRQVLRAEVSDARTRLRIWVNHPSEPDRVVLGLG